MCESRAWFPLTHFVFCTNPLILSVFILGDLAAVIKKKDCDLIQSKIHTFVERVAKKNSEHSGDCHKIKAWFSNIATISDGKIMNVMKEYAVYIFALHLS